MTMAYPSQPPPRGRPPPNPAQIQKLLDENSQLIKTITEYQSQGKPQECFQYQQSLHRNLMYLASMADTSQNMAQFLPVRDTPG
ncbi:Calcium-responsive transactivator [Portunus trituberculatus]|uniref:Calcium-responsive transactivator n=1 Tax=Portunus trituberculatus TaxID=210409 RepID=A0A5B7CR90_PORTR|nr:Calcium-responsive transactivator [Portunus trituberculatus]